MYNGKYSAALGKSLRALRSRYKSQSMTPPGLVDADGLRLFAVPMSRVNSIAVVWFRVGDLRVTDHEPLHCALRSSADKVFPFFCLPDRSLRPSGSLGLPRTGPHRLVGLLQAVASLKENIQRLGSDMILTSGSTGEALQRLLKLIFEAEESVVSISLHYYQAFLPEDNQEEEETSAALIEFTKKYGVSGIAEAIPSRHTLCHLDDITNAPGGCRNNGLPPGLLPKPGGNSTMTEVRRYLQSNTVVRKPFPAPKKLPSLPESWKRGGNMVDLERGLFQLRELHADLNQTVKRLYAAAGASEALQSLEKLVGPITLADKPPTAPIAPPQPFTETDALARLDKIASSSAFMANYRDSRMEAGASDGSALLSTCLSLGTLSPRTVYWETLQSMMESDSKEDARVLLDAWSWTEPSVTSPGQHWLLMHMGIRDFFLLTALKQREDPEREAGGEPILEAEGVWRGDHSSAHFSAWAQGLTGFPFVDANMRQIIATGWMSNRGRQNVASFLSKALKFDWRLGAELFQALLIDHDPAINLGNWAYVAGAEAHPRSHRAFKTVTQGERYDPSAEFISAWVPELADLPISLRHRPWEIEGNAVMNRNRKGGYPTPILPPDGQIGRGPKTR